jgi:hypothetical protein
MTSIFGDAVTETTEKIDGKLKVTDMFSDLGICTSSSHKITTDESGTALNSDTLVKIITLDNGDKVL